MKLSVNNLILILIALFVAGCSNSGLVDPSIPTQERDLDNSTHQLWGLWQFKADPQEGTLEIAPIRDAQLHLNAMKFLEPPANLYITLEGPPHFSGGVIDIDIGLRHPFLGEPRYTGFDVAGILISTGSVSGFEDTGVVLPGSGDTRLLNADGYSRFWNPMEYPVNDGTIFCYQDGLLGVPHAEASFNATVNGYKYFCDSLATNDDINNLDPSTEWSQFSAGQKNVRHYRIQIGDNLIFNYAVDANWKQPSGGPPIVVPDSFPPGAWRTEAWNVSITELENTLWNDGYSSGGDLSLLIDVWDHYNADANGVLVEAPASSIYAVSDSPISSGTGYATHQIDIVSASPEPGIIDLFISVDPQTPGGARAYFVYMADVAAIAGKCEGLDEIEPNDGCADASPLEIDIPAYGCVVQSSDDWDFWQFEVTTEGNYDLILYNDGVGDLDLLYYDSECSWLGVSGSAGAGEDEMLLDTVMLPGIYNIGVKADTDSGPYAGERPYHLSVGTNQPGEWTIETLRQSSADGESIDMSLHPDTDYPFVTLVGDELYNPDPYSAHSFTWDGAEWHLGDHWAAHLGKGTGAAHFTADNYRGIFFARNPNAGDDLWLTYSDGSSWLNIDHVSNGTPTGLSCAVDQSNENKVYLACWQGSTLSYFAYSPAPVWPANIVDTIGGSYTDCWISSDGTHYIAYNDPTNDTIKMAYGTPGSFELVTVPAGSSTSYTGRVGISGHDAPAGTTVGIVYRDNESSKLNFAEFNLTDWTVSTIDTVGNPGEYCSIDYDSEGVRHVAYYVSDTGDLYYGKSTNGTGWETSMVDGETTDSGVWCVIKVTPDGKPRIAYGELGSPRKTKFAWGN